MTQTQIKKGKKMLERYAETNNVTFGGSSVAFNEFLSEINLSATDFLIGFKNHPFVMVQSRIMFSQSK